MSLAVAALFVKAIHAMLLAMRIVLALLWLSLLIAAPMRPPLERYSPSPDQPAYLVKNKWGDQPLITLYSYRAIADIVIDDYTQSFDPDAVQLGDILYVNVWFLDWFEKQVLHKIQVPFILLTCDVGGMTPTLGQFKSLLYDPKVAAWFGKNMPFSHHPKCFQIAMGQNDMLWTSFYSEGFKDYYLNLVTKREFPKTHLLYMNYFPRRYGNRDKIVKLFENAPYCFSRNRSGEEFVAIKRSQYFDELASSHFVISPIGYEIDCVRNWEAFPLQCVPIVEHTFLDPLYEGLPIVFVDNYEQVTQEFLEEKIRELAQMSFRPEKAFFSYWEKQIKEAQTQIRSDPTHYSSLDRTKWSAQDLADLALIFAHKEPPHHNALLCIGTLMGLRSLQLSYVCDGSVAVMDPWPLDYLPTGQICLLPCSRDALYEYLRNPLHHSDTLLDLSYFRSSLHLHPQLFPHATLERDISMIYDLMERGRVLVGNMLADPYVSKTVRQLAEENEWSVQQQGAFWFVVKD